MTIHPKTAKNQYSARLAEVCCDLARRKRASARLSADDEDAAQDACVRALQLETQNKIVDPVRYILRIARNAFIDTRRRHARESLLFKSPRDADFAASDGMDPERILRGRQALGRVAAAIDILPPRCREAFELHRFEELNYAAIARRMGISISMVEKHIAEAMLRLKRAMDGKEEKP